MANQILAVNPQDSQANDDAWWREVRATIREGLRKRNEIQLGWLRYWRIDSTVYITNEDKTVSISLPYDSEVEAIMALTDITASVMLGKPLAEVLERDDLPVELLS